MKQSLAFLCSVNYTYQSATWTGRSYINGPEQYADAL